MPSPVVHFEIRSADPDATRAFYGKLFGWTYQDGGMPRYTYVDTGVEGGVPGGISPLQAGAPLVTFFIGVAELILKAFDVAEQRSKLRKKSLLIGLPSGPFTG